jgi:long-chain fatty acid transport protein
MPVTKLGLAAACAATALLCAHSAALAAGFYLQEQSVAGLGRAFAGAAAQADGPSSLYFNPALATSLAPGKHAEIGVHVIAPKAEVKNRGTAGSLNGVTFPITVAGGAGGNPYDPTPVPQLAAAMPLNADHSFWAGLHVGAPFGLENTYQSDWFGRYDSTKTDLKTYDISPSLSYKVSDRLSVGIAADIQRADVELRSAVPDVALASFGLPVGTPYDGIGDGDYRVKGDDWSYGANLGLTFKPVDSVIVGVSYRTAIHHQLEGDASLTLPTGTVVRGSGAAELSLPDIAAFGATYRVAPDWTVLGGVTWFNWSKFNAITVISDNANLNTTREQNYKDTFAFNAGVEHMLSDAWTLRAGVQYDQTPTQDGYRTSRTPDGDRLWLSAGASYRLNDTVSLDAGYAFIHVASQDIDLPLRYGAAQTQLVRMQAETEGRVQIVSAALRLHF